MKCPYCDYEGLGARDREEQKGFRCTNCNKEFYLIRTPVGLKSVKKRMVEVNKEIKRRQ